MIEEEDKVTTRPHRGDPLQLLRELLNRYQPVSVPGLPRFYGGAVGYLGYEMVRYFEKLPVPPPDDLALDEAVFVVSDAVMIFDNIKHTIKIVVNAFTEDADSPEDIYVAACRKIEALIETINACAFYQGKDIIDTPGVSFSSNVTQAEYENIVQRARE